MSYGFDRDEYMAIMTREGVSVQAARRVLSLTQTIHRLAVAQCNGDWPADNGQRPVTACPQCDRHWAPNTVTRLGCQDCQAEAKIRQALFGTGVEPIFGGDPRGAVVKLRVPSGATNDWGREGICVPVRDR